MSSVLGALLAIATVGYVIGGIGMKRVRLRTSGVLIAALCLGHLGYGIPGIITIALAAVASGALVTAALEATADGAVSIGS